MEYKLTREIIGKAIEIHKTLGPGLLESVYEHLLYFELREAGFKVEQQLPIPIKYKGEKLKAGFRLDLLVEDKVIVEIKSVKEIAPVHRAQTLTYLKLSGLKLGLLINFNTVVLKNGVKRFINTR